MKALILTEGGQGIGFGHVARCTALKKALENYSIKTAMAVRGNSSIRKQFPSETNQFFDWLSDKNRINKLLKETDIVIIDSYLAPRDFYQRISKIVPICVYIDDFLRLSYPSGIVTNSTFDAKKIKYPKGKSTRYLLGSKYALLRQEFWSNPKRKVRKSIRNVLVTFGGTNRPILIQELLSRLQKKYSKLNFHVIASQRSQNGSNKVTYHQNIKAKDMKKLIYECDIAISAGGQTLNELTACGTPVIGVCLAENQRLNIQGCQRHGFLEYAGDSSDSAVFQSIESLFSQFTFKRRRKIAEIGQELIDGLGALRLANEIISSCFRFQNVRTKDRKQIYQWSNAPEVRAISFNTEPIKWADHCKWFAKKLKDPKCLFFKIKWLNHSIGQIRFELNGRTANISVSLGRKYRGQGLGTQAIRLSTKKIFNLVPRIFSVDAFVRGENKSSVNAFLKAGFKYGSKKTVHQEKVLRFKKTRYEIIPN